MTYGEMFDKFELQIQEKHGSKPKEEFLELHMLLSQGEYNPKIETLIQDLDMIKKEFEEVK